MTDEPVRQTPDQIQKRLETAAATLTLRNLGINISPVATHYQVQGLIKVLMALTGMSREDLDYAIALAQVEEMETLARGVPATTLTLATPAPPKN